MANSTRNSIAGQVQAELLELLKQAGITPFGLFLSRPRIQEALDQAQVKSRDVVYTPEVTILAFLAQVMTHGTCETAVARIIAHRLEIGKKACSENTTSYCDARIRIPETVVSGIAKKVGSEVQKQGLISWMWKNLNVEMVDGSTSPMADTDANQKEYPQSKNQKRGLGFPILRFVVLISLSVGTVLECAIGACRGKKTGEQNLFRQFRDQIKPGTVLLGDRLYDAYVDIACLLKRNVHVVFGMNQSRKHDFRRGRKLGASDHVVIWNKPRYDKSRFDSKEAWEALPETLEMRETRIVVTRKGCKARTIIVVTSLLDHTVYTKADLMDLFAQRWNCELDLRSIKCSLSMRELKCKTPSMVRKELWMYLLAYNLTRERMMQAAVAHNMQPRRLSFESAKTHINAIMQIIGRVAPEAQQRLEMELLRIISRCELDYRPGRKEPRAVKKRTPKYPKLTKPRNEARKGLMA